MKDFNLKDLQKEVSFKWKVQSQQDQDYQFNGPSVTCVAYIDARQVQDLFDEVVGPENWCVEFNEKFGQLFCRIGIFVNGHWVYKEDVGTESMAEKEKGQVSDSFKRAAVHWGVGRFLYRKEMQKVAAQIVKGNGRNKFYPINDQGKKLYGGDALTAYINSKMGNASKTNVNTPKKDNVSNETFSQKKGNGVPFTVSLEENKSESVTQSTAVSMPVSFQERFLGKKVEEVESVEFDPKTAFGCGDKELEDVLYGMFSTKQLKESYLLDNKKWLTGLPSARKSLFMSLVPIQFKQRVIEILSDK